MLHKFNCRALAVSIAALTTAGTFTPINLLSPQASAQTATCNGSAGRPISEAPAAFRQEAQEAANASTSPDVRLTVFNTENERINGSTVTIFEFNGTLPNGCQLEIDVLRNPNSGQIVTQEIETELLNRSALPASVRQRLDQAPLGNRFAENVFERSVRPSPQPFGHNVPPVGPSDTVFEIGGNCTGDIEFFGGNNSSQACGPGEEFPSAEAVINSGGNLILIENNT